MRSPLRRTRQQLMGGEGRWPAAPALPRPAIMGQSWLDAVFLHWRIDQAAAAALMPAGVVPDLFDDAAWVGLIGFKMRGAGIGSGKPVPYLGGFTEVNVRLYSREPDGTRGVVFATLDASRLLPVLAARAAGLPYVWSQCRPWAGIGARPSQGYEVRRFRGGACTRFSVEPEPEPAANDDLSVHLTARFGLHSRWGGQTWYIPNYHKPWPLRRAVLADLDDTLLVSAGVPVSGPPESVLYSPGVQTQFGRPRALARV